MLTIGSLFSGIGGLELGLEWAGLGPVIWQVEKDEKCRNCLAHHWPNAKRFEDVCTVGRNELEPVDLICGGFPCQDISSAGKRAGLRGSRSGLWFEFERIVSELRPRWVVVENVASGATKWVDEIRVRLERLGYGSLPIPLAASDCGAWHRRGRVFIIANRDDQESDSLPERAPTEISVPPGALADVESQRPGQPDTATDSRGAGGEAWCSSECGGALPAEPQWTCDRSIWSAEPDVARMVHGFPGELEFINDIGKQINNPKKNATARFTVWKMLRAMWEHRELAATSPELYRERLHNRVPEMSHRRAHGGWFMGTWEKETEAVRGMWERVHAEPFEETQDLQQKLFEHLREAQRGKALARKGRTDRERALGNSVVPQCAEVVGEVINLLRAAPVIE